jgi:hypothetical protein
MHRGFGDAANGGIEAGAIAAGRQNSDGACFGYRTHGIRPL